MSWTKNIAKRKGKRMSRHISSGQSIGMGLGVSLAIALVPAALVFAALSVIETIYGVLGGLVTLGLVASAINKTGYIGNNPPGVNGLDTLNGRVTGTVRGQGWQWGIKGLQGQIPVNIQEDEFSPEVFQEIVNEVPIEIDIICTGDVTDPAKYFVAKEPEAKLAELVESACRTFTSPWVSSESVVEKKNMLPEYLILPPRDQDPLGKHADFKQRLLASTPTDLSTDAVDGIMEKAGMLVETALRWGITPRLAEIKRFDIPEDLKKLGVKVLFNAKRKAMIAELIATGIKPQDALNAVDMLLELPITKTVNEFQVRDLDKIADNIGKLAVEVIARFVDQWRK